MRENGILEYSTPKLSLRLDPAFKPAAQEEAGQERNGTAVPKTLNDLKPGESITVPPLAKAPSERNMMDLSDEELLFWSIPGEQVGA